MEAKNALKTTEAQVLAAALELLHRHPAIAWVERQNTGAGYVIDSRTYHRLVASGALRPGAARFLRFGFPGAADITGQMRDGRRLEVEAKSARGVLSMDQAGHLARVERAGGVALVVRDVAVLARELGEA